MQVVILAGGRGTRLGEHARAIPKPMVTIGGRPNLEHQTLLARRHGFSKALFLTSHLADRIEAHFGDGRRFDMEISYCVEEPPLGTAGALRLAGGCLDRTAEDLGQAADFILAAGGVEPVEGMPA